LTYELAPGFRPGVFFELAVRSLVYQVACRTPKVTVSNAFRAAALLLAMFAQASTFAQSPAADAAEPLDEVVVTGRFPGPPLWKVSKDGHALWILPLIDLYPKKMEWESARVEKLIGESQEFIIRPGVANGVATANPLLLPRALRLYNLMVHLPDEKTLADVLPPDLYRRFSILKARNFPRNSGIERQTVSAATSSMQQEILEQENLGPMRMDISRWLKGNKTILRTDTTVGRVHGITAKELKALTAAMKEVVATPAYAKAEVACFEVILAYFEKDLEPVKRRANAWAKGRVDDLVDPAPLYGELRDCMDPFSASTDLPAMQKLVKDYPGLASPDLVDMRKQSRQKWLDAAENALSRNATTFSMLAVNDIVDKAGLVAQLEAKGYKVEVFSE
jgi:flavin-binding protein dodecin